MKKYDVNKPLLEYSTKTTSKKLLTFRIEIWDIMEITWTFAWAIAHGQKTIIAKITKIDLHGTFPPARLLFCFD